MSAIPLQRNRFKIIYRSWNLELPASNQSFPQQTFPDIRKEGQPLFNNLSLAVLEGPLSQVISGIVNTMITLLRWNNR